MKKLLAIVTSKEFWFGIWIATMILALVLLFICVSADAQNVVRKGNTFYQQSNSNKIEAVFA